MPSSPRRQPRRAYIPLRPRTPTSDQGFYNSTAWRKCRHAFRALPENLLCAVCQEPGSICDHVIPIDAGGAKLDFDNLMTLCDGCHNRKSGMEAHAGALLTGVPNRNGDLVPRNKKDAIEKLKA